MTMSAATPMYSKMEKLRIEGDVTIYQTAELQIRLLTRLAEAVGIELDLSGIDKIDATGLQLLVSLTVSEKPVLLRDPSPTVKQLLNLLGLNDFLPLLNATQTTERGTQQT